MADTVVILSVKRVRDLVRCIGTVDGDKEEVEVWWSHLTTLPSDTARQTYIAQRLIAVHNNEPADQPQLIPSTPITI